MINWIMGIGGAVIAALIALLGFKSSKLKKTKKELEEKKEEVKLHKIVNSLEHELQESSCVEEKTTNDRISEVRNETAGKLAEDSIDYNKLIRDWNNEGK